MKITVLGSYSPYPAAGGACSGYLVEENDTKLLLECGNGVIANLHKLFKAWHLDAAVVSHLHADHCGDLALLRYAMRAADFLGYRKNKLPVLIAGLPREKFNLFTDFTDFLDFITIEDIKCGSVPWIRETRCGDLKIEFIENKHSITAYAVAVTGRSGKRLVFSSDTEYTEKIEYFAKNADLLLCEATVIERDSSYARGRHLTARQAGELGSRAGVKRLLITHFFPEYSFKTLIEEASEGFGREVEAAKENKSYQI